MSLILKRFEGHVYVTEPFVPPEGSFRLEIEGYDNERNEVKRIISTYMRAVEGKFQLVVSSKK
jgi:hypothetical protein